MRTIKPPETVTGPGILTLYRGEVEVTSWVLGAGEQRSALPVHEPALWYGWETEDEILAEAAALLPDWARRPT